MGMHHTSCQIAISLDVPWGGICFGHHNIKVGIRYFEASERALSTIAGRFYSFSCEHFSMPFVSSFRNILAILAAFTEATARFLHFQ
jgi:hypothetical protein